MQRFMLALLLAVVIALVLVTGFFMVFNFQGWPQVGKEFISLVAQAEYWAGLGIFSFLFFIFFTLPVSLMML